MRRPRRLELLAALIGLAALGGAGASAFAAGPASRASVQTVYLKVGDQIYVKGAPLACVVQRNSGTINIVCVKGSPSAPSRGAYGVGIADGGADLAVVSKSSAKLVKRIAEPVVSGAKFAMPTGKVQSYTLAAPTAVLVGGTHIFCAVERAAGTINVTCGLSSLAAHLQYPVGSYITSESSRFALMGQVEPKGAFKTVAARAQP